MASMDKREWRYQRRVKEKREREKREERKEKREEREEGEEKKGKREKRLMPCRGGLVFDDIQLPGAMEQTCYKAIELRGNCAI